MNRLMFPIAEHHSQLPILDLNKFRTLVPINSLYEENLTLLVKKTRVEHLKHGDQVFSVGDQDADTLFLISGEITQIDANGWETPIRAGSPMADYALANVKPRTASARVSSDTAIIAAVNSQLLNKLLAWGQIVLKQASIEGAEDDFDALVHSEWMTHMLRTQAFLKLPAGNIQALFEQLEQVAVKAGAVILRAGESGDYYYMIKQGRCQVTRSTPHGEVPLATLAAGDNFGEDALVSSGSRNATVTMLTDGILMRLSKASFQDLLKAPLLEWVSVKQAKTEVKNGAILVDVRLESEYQRSGIKGSINIPLYLLRIKTKRLNPAKRYIVYCDTDSRSAAAAFILAHQGFDVAVLKDGVSALGHRLSAPREMPTRV